jgi:hypothetical protein
MPIGRKSRRSDLVRRVLAAGAAALVFALGLFAASPVLHKHLHGGDPSLEEGCPIVLFANGVSIAVAVTAPLPPPAHPVDAARPAASEIFLDSPRYLLQPERGPPRA